MPSPTTRSRPRLPVALQVVTGLWGVLLLGASLLWPMGEGYDELTHLDMAYAYAHDPGTFYGPGELVVSSAMAGMQRQMGGIPPKEPLADQDPVARGERPTFDELGGPVRPEEGAPNQMVQHPPGAYWVYAAVLRFPGVADLGWDVQVWLLRLVGIVLVLPIPVLAWGAARRLLDAEGVAAPVAGRLALVAAVIPLSMPNLVRVSASVNNDVLLIASCSLLCYLLVRVMTGDLRRRTGAAIAACLVVALLTKGFALVLPPVVLAAYVLGGLRERRWRAAAGGLLVSAVGGLLGGLWWLRNLVVDGRIQSSGYGEPFLREHWGVVGDGDDGRLRDFVGPFLTHFVERIWGGIGLADQLTPGAPIVYGWFALAAAAVVVALVSRPPSGSGHARARATVFAAAALLTVVVVAQGSFELWQRKAIGPAAAQGRYVYHLVVGLSALVVLGCARALRSHTVRHLPIVVLAAGLLTQALSWSVILRNWYGAEGSLGSALDALLRWSPVAGPVTFVAVVALPLVAGLAALAVVVRWTRAPDPLPDVVDAAPPAPPPA